MVAVTGLRAEARIAERSQRVEAIAGGGDVARLEILIARAIALGGKGIISFGIAGALRPDLEPGTWLVGREVIDGSECYRSDEVWSARIRKRLGAPDLIKIVGVEQPVARPFDKRTLFEKTGAAAVDMESHIVARLAATHGLPFAVLRVIADSQQCAVPPAALAGMRSDGTADVAAVLRSLSRDLRQLPALMRVAADTRRALAVLFRCHRLLGPGLGLFDLG